MRSYKTEGIIIKRRNFGEADRIITVLTKHKGKIQAKATGVRRIQSRRSSHIELLNHSVIFLYKGRGTLPVLTEAETLEEFSIIKNDLTKIGFAYHLCELVNGLCAENEENFDVFRLFLNTLKRLSIEKDIASAIHEFEIELLTVLGFWPRYRSSQNLNTHYIIENILERPLKSKNIFSKLQ
ncbi:MAG: DNA repair protein RecO [Candidatus Levybacteria bacterium]|nr:DNA repair protein RecO [Candidatus Levybacteria bacterium]